MVFFCFSSKDRHDIVESIFFHISSYAIPIWYDRHKMLLGDERDYKNFTDGVESCDYAVIILSKNTLNSKCAKEEIALIYSKHQKSEITVFPIFYNLLCEELPNDVQWLTKLVYKELNPSIDSRSTCNHIICKLLLDDLQKCRLKSINEVKHYFRNNATYTYLKEIINAYSIISDENHNAQIALLYAGALYLKSYYNLNDTPDFYLVGLERIFNETKLNLPIDLRETLIFERLFLLLINHSIFGNII
jgi:hypothetical protein